MSDEALVALIHLSAVVAAIAIVSAKMDRTHDGGPEPPEDGLVAAQPMAREIVLKLGITKPLSELSRGKWGLKTIFPAGVICRVADTPIKFGVIRGFLHFFYRQVHIPFLSYFRSRLHRLVVCTIALLSVGAFLAFVAATLWEFGWAESEDVLRVSYFVLVAFAFWIFITNLISPRLSRTRLETKCKNLHRAIDTRFARRLEKAAKTVEAFDLQIMR